MHYLGCQNRSDLLNVFQERGLWGSGTCSCFLAPLVFFLPRKGLNNFFNTFWKPEPRQRRCFTWWPVLTRCGIVCWDTTDLANPGSDRLLCNMALLRWDSNDSLSNWSNRVLCSSPNLFRIIAISSINCICCCKLRYHFHKWLIDRYLYTPQCGMGWLKGVDFSFLLYIVSVICLEDSLCKQGIGHTQELKRLPNIELLQFIPKEGTCNNSFSSKIYIYQTPVWCLVKRHALFLRKTDY